MSLTLQTSFKSPNETLYELMLTNRPRNLVKSRKFEICSSYYCHKLVVSILRAFFKKLPSKIITYGNQTILTRKILFVICTADNYRVSFTETLLRQNFLLIIIPPFVPLKRSRKKCMSLGNPFGYIKIKIISLYSSHSSIHKIKTCS